MLAVFGTPGPAELFILAFILIKLVLIVAIIAFVARKFPELMRGVGRGVGAFQRGVDEGRRGQ
jgi:Sec-independent protein translocase protein TatA